MLTSLVIWRKVLLLNKLRDKLSYYFLFKIRKFVIDQNNFKNLLNKIGFSENNNVYRKKFANVDAYLKVNFEEEKLIYPTDKGLKINGSFTTTFKQNENFVVFECINRLFEKGYKPHHIELEPQWTVGHGASGGRADVMVKDNSGRSLLIIECKTAGREFDREWKKTLINGGQIFSYAKQAGSTEFISLYTSNYVDNQIIYSYCLITLKDNEKLLEELVDNKPLSYKKAKLLDKEDIYLAWKETYNLDYATRGIFENDISAYEIGKTKYSLKDLDTISSNDIQGKYHQFATILRQHNVSGRENAFDKLVNLFLCKIVDETNNPEALKFYWKGIAYDSYFDLQDRLQKLYQEGMKRFLGEDVTYIDNQAIEQAFRFFQNDPDATKETIKKYFRQLKFFTDNDFAFINVHNEKLFYQNATVLLKIVRMLQDIKLKTKEENQFLGDMFEGFLDQGIKQTEGQFFTPIPIVKFILKSLPLEQIIKESDRIPKAIDFACGAGHFLNEYAQEIKLILEQQKDINIEEYYENVVGIEKEYRLSKVAKVSAFMYGQDDINIIYADALASISTIKDNSFSVLVANPPYSVKGFLETLSEADRKNYRLIKTVGEKSYSNNNSIETFFLERAKQLLKPGGVAGIIFPSSILSKGKAKSTSRTKNIYVATREILLKFFDIIAIAEFGSGTFGKTGSSTITLFIRRKQENPAPADHYYNRVSSWFRGDKAPNKVFEDEYFIREYCAHLDFEFEDYETLLNGKPNKALLKSENFLDYKHEFDNWTEIKNIKKQYSKKIQKLIQKTEKEIIRKFKDKRKTRTKTKITRISKRVTISEKLKLVEKLEVELQKRFLAYLKKVESEKLYFFTMAKLNSQQVIIVKSPSKTTELKEFLGYEWSSAKGNEGIKYLGTTTINKIEGENEEEEMEILEKEDKRVLSNLLNLENITTPLYDSTSKTNNNKISYLINCCYKGENGDIPDKLLKYVFKLDLIDMIDFSSVDFNKTISLIEQNEVVITTKWDLVRLKDVTKVKNGGTPDTKNSLFWDNGDIYWATLADTKKKYLDITQKKITKAGLENSSAVLLPVNTVIFSSRATIGEVTINRVETATNQGYKNFICDS